MLDSNDLIKIIKKIVVETVENTKPCNYVFGEVTKVDPLEINVEQKFILSEEMLTLTKSVTKQIVPLELDFDSEGNTTNITVKKYESEEYPHTHEVEENEHKHMIKQELELEIVPGLEVGEIVILLRQSGGQKYLVLDRVWKKWYQN